MIIAVTVGIVTKSKVVSTMVLAMTGAFWIVGSVCLTVASLEEDDDWDTISSKLWGNVMVLFAVGSGLLYGKWMATHV